MKKKDKIYDSPEYKQIKEHLPEILKELERDKGLSQYQIPEEWNGDFERIYQKECRKEHIKRRILAGACAAVILTISAVHIGTHLEFTSVAQADDIGKIHETEIEGDRYKYSLYGNSDENQKEIFAEDDEIFFTCNDLEQLNVEMKEKIKAPLFSINENLGKEYFIKDATYSKVHRNINYRIEWNEKYVYVNQQMQIEDTGSGAVDEKQAEKQVYIESLQQTVPIYYNAHEGSLNCNVVHDKSTLFLVSNLNIDEFEKIIESIDYK